MYFHLRNLNIFDNQNYLDIYDASSENNQNAVSIEVIQNSKN